MFLKLFLYYFKKYKNVAVRLFFCYLSITSSSLLVYLFVGVIIIILVKLHSSVPFLTFFFLSLQWFDSNSSFVHFFAQKSGFPCVVDA